MNFNASTFVQLVVVGGHFSRGHALQRRSSISSTRTLRPSLPDCCHFQSNIAATDNDQIGVRLHAVLQAINVVHGAQVVNARQVRALNAQFARRDPVLISR